MTANRFSPGSTGLVADPVERSSSTSLDLPTIGQEGQEYEVITDELSLSADTRRRSYGSSPEHTRTVGEDVKLFAPKPTMPAQSAKQRVAAVTRTDSDRAAAFGIGKPSSEDPTTANSTRSLKKKASTTSELSQSSHAADNEHGIPEIGVQVPMYPNAGDVQAPSPAPASFNGDGAAKTGRNHTRRTSARGGFEAAPPGSYGLHGHGIDPTHKLEKAYYEKRPDLKKQELHNHLHDRINDFSRSSEELNKIVRDTASLGAGSGTNANYVGTPSEQVGFQATDEYTSRISSPRPPSTQPKQEKATYPLTKTSFSADDDVIHVNEPGYRGFVKRGDAASVTGEGTGDDFDTPILASDEIAKGPSPYDLQPAVEPPPARSGSAFEMELPKSRPTSRPPSVYSPPPPELRQIPLEDVEEYEPLPFRDDDTNGKKLADKLAEKLKDHRSRFPSRDIWEDAPNSVHATAEVSTPEPTEGLKKRQELSDDIPPRDTETPAQAFARKQEELAETEDRSPDSLLHGKPPRPRSWIEQQPRVVKENPSRPAMTNRFPSRDVWEDTPDSHHLQTTVSTPQQDNAEEHSPVEKLVVPARPAKKQGSGDDKPVIPDRPKPQIPPRPLKPASESKGPEPVPKQKPAVPARPLGGKIAALQAGFMSDLNKRLQLGPQAPKKEEPKTEEVVEEKEKVPLSDARKGRARGPQRRAPTKAQVTNAVPIVAVAPDGKPVLSFSAPHILFSIDEEGTMTVDGDAEKTPTRESPMLVAESAKPEEPAKEHDIKTTTAEEEPSKPTETASGDDNKVEETKTLATDWARESNLIDTVSKKDGDQVEDVETVEDEVVS